MPALFQDKNKQTNKTKSQTFGYVWYHHTRSRTCVKALQETSAMRTKDHKIICVNSVVHKSPASHAATVCVCVCLFWCSHICVVLGQWGGFPPLGCRVQSFSWCWIIVGQSVSLWLVSQDLPFCVFKITYPFSPLCPGILGRGKLRDFFLNSSGKAVEGCFLYLENQTRSWGLHCCGCHFFNCFFFFFHHFHL